MRALEEVVAPAPIRIAVPVGIVVMHGLEEALGVGHEPHGATCGVLEGGDALLRPIVIVGVLERDTAASEVLLRIPRLADEASLGVRGGELEVLGQQARVGAISRHLDQLLPHAFEALAHIPDERGLGQDAQLGEDLEAIADAEEQTALVVVLRERITEESLGLQLRDATTHDVVSVGEAAGEDDELRLLDVSRGGGGDGLHLRGEARDVERARRLDVAVRARVF